MGRGPLLRRHSGTTSVLADAPPARLCAYLLMGLCVGLFLGYIMMGTAHAMLETHTQSTTTNNNNNNNNIPPHTTIHILATSNGSPYQNYQMRIAYATYKLIQKMPGGERHVAFTRILHRTKPDELMDEIPTFRADPLQPKCDEWCEYPVSDRANAVRQFLEAAREEPSMIKAPWLYMIESDYVFMKPLELPPPSKSLPGQAWAFPFEYIQPTRFPTEMRQLYPESAGPVSNIPPTGPAPVLMLHEDWERVTPEWERLAAVIEADPILVQKLGWVREMYGFSAALALLGFKIDLTPPTNNRFIVQLPIDEKLGNAHAFHYTQCTIYKSVSTDKEVWGYDKRFYTSLEDALNVPRIETPPKYKKGAFKFIEGEPVSAEKHAAIEQMIAQMNRGINALYDLTQI